MVAPKKPDIEAKRQQVDSALKEVLRSIESLPTSLPLGTPEGLIAMNFGNFNIDDDEGPFFSVNQAWERTFQKTPEAAITRGPYGIKLVHDFLAYFLHIPGIEANGGLDLMLLRVTQLGELLCKVSSITKVNNATSSGLKIKLKGIHDLDLDVNDFALSAGLEKLRKHLKKAFDSHFPLLGAVLHPSIRLVYFQDLGKWTGDVPARAETLLEHLFDEYSSDLGTESDHALSRTTVHAVAKEPKSIFDQAISLGTTDFLDDMSTPGLATLKQSELATYFGGAYPCKNQNDPLGWWKTHESQFPVLSRIARDVLAIPGVSVSVERLFSSTKHTLSDSRSSMTASTASKTVLTKEWLRKGLGDGVTYLDNISVHRSNQ